jgi:hypothetical protein
LTRETKQYEGKQALQQLDSEGNVYAYAVLAKNADGQL